MTELGPYEMIGTCMVFIAAVLLIGLANYITNPWYHDESSD